MQNVNSDPEITPKNSTFHTILEILKCTRGFSQKQFQTNNFIVLQPNIGLQLQLSHKFLSIIPLYFSKEQRSFKVESQKILKNLIFLKGLVNILNKDFVRLEREPNFIVNHNFLVKEAKFLPICKKSRKLLQLSCISALQLPQKPLFLKFQYIPKRYGTLNIISKLCLLRKSQ